MEHPVFPCCVDGRYGVNQVSGVAGIDARSGESMTQSVARHLREGIYEGTFSPGMHIRQEALASELGISRIPVREALRQLESEGLVVIRPNSGARIAVLDFEEYSDIYKIRERLEPLALAESIPKLNDEQRAEVELMAEELESLTHNPAAFLDADRRFHVACYAGAPSKRLRRMIEGFWNETQRYRRILLTTFTDDDFARTNSEHRLIVNAVQAGNTRTGEDLIRMHIERSRLRLADHRELFDQ